MAIHSWKNKAKKDHKKHIKEGIHHHDLGSPREKHLGIIGLNEGLDKQGLPHNLEPSHVNRAHNGHEDGAHHEIVHGGEHHKHPGEILMARLVIFSASQLFLVSTVLANIMPGLFLQLLGM